MTFTTVYLDAVPIDPELELENMQGFQRPCGFYFRAIASFLGNDRSFTETNGTERITNDFI